MQQLTFDDTRTSQAQAILAYMQAGNRITPLEALRLFGCFRLGGRIYDLKETHPEIESEFVVVGTKRVKQYWIPQGK